MPSGSSKARRVPASVEAQLQAASYGRSRSTARTTREAAARLIARAGREMDSWWRTRTVAGPIDVLDFFSGCGGMSAGFAAVNGVIHAYRIAGAVDIDGIAAASFAANLGVPCSLLDAARLVDDDRALEAFLQSCRLRSSAPLVLIGCAPCQGFSSHRNDAGPGDSRNSLYVDFAKIAARLVPEVVIAENVPEILTERYWPLVCHARSILEKAGYFVQISVHNTAEFGVAQERFRAVLIAMRRPFGPMRGAIARDEFKTVREAIGHLPSIAAGQRDPNDAMHYTAGHRETTLETIRAVPKNGGSRPEDAGPECLRRAKERAGRAAYEDVYGRLYWDRPSITVTAYARNPASGRFVHPEQDRGLSIREAALLQSFPSDYRFVGTLDECFRQIGNAVPPVFANSLALFVLGELLGSPVRVEDFDPGITASVGASFSRLIPSLKAQGVAREPRRDWCVPDAKQLELHI